MVRLEAEASEPPNALKRDVFSAKPETIENEPVRDLNIESLPVGLEAEPSIAPRLIVRPLKSEVAWPREPMRALNNEVFSVMLVADPIETLRFTV